MRCSPGVSWDEAIELLIDSLLTPIAGREVARLGALYVQFGSREAEPAVMNTVRWGASVECVEGIK